jgi:hypothetical protein
VAAWTSSRLVKCVFEEQAHVDSLAWSETTYPLTREVHVAKCFRVCDGKFALVHLPCTALAIPFFQRVNQNLGFISRILIQEGDSTTDVSTGDKFQVKGCQNAPGVFQVDGLLTKHLPWDLCTRLGHHVVYLSCGLSVTCEYHAKQTFPLHPKGLTAFAS